MRPPLPRAPEVICPYNSAVLLGISATTILLGKLHDDSNHNLRHIKEFTDSKNEILRDKNSIKYSFAKKQQLINPIIERLEKWSACQQFFPPWLSKETQASLQNVLEETVDVLDSEVVIKKSKSFCLLNCFRFLNSLKFRKPAKNAYKKSLSENNKFQIESKFASFKETNDKSRLARTLRHFADSILKRFLETDSLVKELNIFDRLLMAKRKRAALAQNMLVQYQLSKSVLELVRSSVDLEYIPPSLAITLEYCKSNSKPKKYSHILSPIYDLALPGTEFLRKNIAAIRSVVNKEYVRYSPDRFKLIENHVDVATLNEQQSAEYLEVKMKVISSILSGENKYISNALFAEVMDDGKLKEDVMECEGQELSIVEIAMIVAKSVKFCDIAKTIANLLKRPTIEIPDDREAIVDQLYRAKRIPTNTTISMLTASQITGTTCSQTDQSDTRLR